jgi:hypothetical protein
MNFGVKPLSWLLVWSAAAGLAGGAAAAQDTAPAAASPPSAPATPTPGGSIGGPTKSTAQIDAGEPRANTSPGASAAARGAPAPAGTPATPPGTAAASRAPHAAGQKAPGTADRVDLSTATVTGDREQPKVMYIVPWKRPDIGDLSGKPMNSLLDEALAPIDRDEFKREVAYYDAVKADAPQNGASNAAAQGEK